MEESLFKRANKEQRLYSSVIRWFTSTPAGEMEKPTFIKRTFPELFEKNEDGQVMIEFELDRWDVQDLIDALRNHLSYSCIVKLNYDTHELSQLNLNIETEIDVHLFRTRMNEDEIEKLESLSETENSIAGTTHMEMTTYVREMLKPKKDAYVVLESYNITKFSDDDSKIESKCFIAFFKQHVCLIDVQLSIVAIKIGDKLSHVQNTNTISVLKREYEREGSLDDMKYQIDELGPKKVKWKVICVKDIVKKAGGEFDKPQFENIFHWMKTNSASLGPKNPAQCMKCGKEVSKK